jgi:elongation factor P
MKINGNTIRPGNVIDHQGRLWVAVKIQHTQPGKGGAYLQVELKDIRNGTKLNERFRSSENVERVRLEEKPFQFLYAEEDMITFMDVKTYDQINLPKSAIGEGVIFLQDEMQVLINCYEGEPISVQLPPTVSLIIQETEPVMKGQTAAASYKPAILENGLRIMVPPHIQKGERIVVNTEDSSYVERARS